MNVHTLVMSAVRRVADAGIPDADIEVHLLLGHLLKLNRAQLALAATEEIPEQAVHDFEKALERRLKREPLAYIIEEQEFWSLTFKVTPDVLIPRPETELLIEKVLLEPRKEGGRPGGPVLDLGTGSGVIPVVLALELPDTVVFGLDRSCSALQVAAYNAVRHNVADRVCFINSNWLDGIAFDHRFPVVVTNPPYVAGEVLDGLQPEVIQYEPCSALDGGRHGMELIEIIADQVRHVLMPGGWFFMEIGADQKQRVLRLFESLNEFECLVVHSDYAGLPRILQARRKVTAQLHPSFERSGQLT